MPPPPSARARVVALVLVGACLLGADFSRPGDVVVVSKPLVTQGGSS